MWGNSCYLRSVIDTVRNFANATFEKTQHGRRIERQSDRLMPWIV